MDIEKTIQEELDKMHPNLEITSSNVGDFLIYKNDNVISKAIRLYGEYCHAEVKVLSKFMDEKNQVFLDIGTNIGYHSVGMHLATDCQVLGFEPNFKHFSVAAYNCKLFPKIQLINRAVSNKESKFFMKDFDESMDSNYGDIHISDEGREVESVVIDKMNISRCNVMKIDVEGHELEVLEGATKTISKTRPVIMYEAMEWDVWTECYSFMAKKRYKQYWVACRTAPIGNTFKNPEENPFGNATVSNILCIPAERPQPDNFIEVVEHEGYRDCFLRYKKLNLLF